MNVAGNTAFFTLVSGIYFEDGDSWQKLVGPPLQALEAKR
jgi:hypothetical protein